MTLDQLKIFVAVAEREHLTRAATDLRLTPSAVSSAIQALERRYGTKLFDRVGRRIELSAEGRAFLTDARATLASAASAERVLTEFGGLARGLLAIAASQTSASHWLPPLAMRFRMAYPAIDMKIAEGNTTSVADAVSAGRADLGIIEGDIDRPELSLTTVDDDRLVVVAAPDNPLAAAWRVGPREIAAARWVMRETGSGTRSVFGRALRADGIDPDALDVVLEFPTNEAVCAAVRSGPCLTAVSNLVARPHIEAGRLKEVRYTLPSRHFALLRHKERYRTKASLAFEALVRDDVREARSRRDPATFDI